MSANDPKRTFCLCAVVGAARCDECRQVINGALVAKETEATRAWEMGLGTVTPLLGENTPGQRSDWFLRVLRGYRGGDHTWEPLSRAPNDH